MFVNRTDFVRFILLFIFRGTAPTDPHQKLKSVGVQPLGFGKGWSLPQERNSASSSQKFADIKRSKTISHNTKQTKAIAPLKATNSKSRMQKRNSRPS